MGIYKSGQKNYNLFVFNTTRGVFLMKRAIAIILATAITVCAVMAGCSDKGKEEKGSTTVDGLVNNEDVYNIDEVEVTDEKGEVVTDKNGKPVTTQIVYKETTDKKGNVVGVLIDENGETVTNKINKKPVTIPTTTTTTTTAAPTVPTSEITTVAPEKDVVPKIDDAVKSASFNENEIKIVTNMLEVPGLFNSNYENEDGVPVDAARHAAVWMAQRDQANANTGSGKKSSYPSGVIVLGLFKFFGQTVVNFKNNCGKTEEITYNSGDDSFTVVNGEEKIQTVTIEKVEEYTQKNNNNYYKVTGTVSNCSKTKVEAIVQQNKLDNSLGFSIKAMRWS